MSLNTKSYKYNISLVPLPAHEIDYTHNFLILKMIKILLEHVSHIFIWLSDRFSQHQNHYQNTYHQKLHTDNHALLKKHLTDPANITKWPETLNK